MDDVAYTLTITYEPGGRYAVAAWSPSGAISAEGWSLPVAMCALGGKLERHEADPPLADDG